MAAGLVALASACGDGLGPSIQLEQNRIKWQRSGIDTYSLIVRRGCECLVPEMTGPVRIEVRAGVIESRTYEDGTAVPASYASPFPDVSGLFAIIEDAIRSSAAELTVAYHPAYGVPMSISVDYDRAMADDEMGWTVQFLQRVASPY